MMPTVSEVASDDISVDSNVFNNIDFRVKRQRLFLNFGKEDTES